MPAAAVIPAPKAYIKVVAVKKLVVGSMTSEGGPPLVRTAAPSPICQFVCVAFNRVAQVTDVFTLKKLECLKQALNA